MNGNWHVGMLAVALIVSGGCAQSESVPDGAQEGTLVDLGQVSLNDGAEQIKHAFPLVNETNQRLEIVGVRKSCGCVSAELGDTLLEPGQTTTLTIGFQLLSVGRSEQGATVLFSDGQRRTFRLAAHGVLGREFIPIIESPYFEGASRHLAVRLYRIDKAGVMEVAPPTVVDPSGVRLVFDRWVTLERQGTLKIRPARQIGSGILDFSQYGGEFPTEVKLRSAGGAECSIRVAGPFLLAASRQSAEASKRSW